MYPITDQVYGVPGMSIGRIYIITGKDGLTLIDTSFSPKTAEKLEPQLREKGYSLSDIHTILITHAHPDHIGGLAGFQKRINARTAVHRRDAPYTRGELPLARAPKEHLGLFGRLLAAGPAPTIHPGRVDLELKEGDTLDDVLPGLQVVETHGHSPGHIGFWWPEKRLLLGGDLLMHLPWGLNLPIPAFTVDMAEAKRSIHKVAAMDVDIHCFGHGAPLVGSAAEKIRTFAARLKD